LWVLSRHGKLEMAITALGEALGYGGAVAIVGGWGLGMDGAGEPVRVFISYAHDDEAHQERVREFWLFLRAHGWISRPRSGGRTGHSG
jgi:hypothetical protein